jgi:hypothetical protein
MVDKVPLCMTAVYSAHQALTAAALGATYAAPYLGRMNDNQRDVRPSLASRAAGELFCATGRGSASASCSNSYIGCLYFLRLVAA